MLEESNKKFFTHQDYLEGLCDKNGLPVKGGPQTPPYRAKEDKEIVRTINQSDIEKLSQRMPVAIEESVTNDTKVKSKLTSTELKEWATKQKGSK